MLRFNCNRRSFVKGGFSAAVISGLPASAMALEPLRDVRYEQDFDELWNSLRDRYCFFGSKATDWQKVRQLYRPMALAADSDDIFLDVIGRVLSELYDAHTHLSNPRDGARRWPLYDLLVERDGKEVRIVAVQPGSAAADAGLAPGDSITAIEDVAIEQVIRDIAPKCLSRPDPAADSYSINLAVAGRRGRPRLLTVKAKGPAVRRLSLPLKQWPDIADVESKRLDQGIGYIAIRSFANSAIADAFDAALTDLRDCDGLLIDVRQNGGGDTAVARPVMGRFVSKRKPYAMMRRRDGAGLSAPWTEWVDPKGPFTYTKPIVILVDHWSASMAEGFPMGMRGIGRAIIVGTAMMGLGAAVFPIRRDRSGIEAQYSAEPVYDVHDNPRWMLRPDVEVGDGKDILAVGIETLRARIG